MNNHSRSTRPTAVLTLFLLLLTLLACKWFSDKPVVENRPTPANPTVTVTPPPITEGELRRNLTNVFAGLQDPLPNLSDDEWHKISSSTRVHTDENGEGWLRIRECMLIYLFQLGDMKTEVCSKGEYASGHANCLSRGTAVYNSTCKLQAEQLVQTPTADVSPSGTWFSVTYVPEQQATLVLVFDGTVTVTPVKDFETRSLGESVKITAGQAWVTAPDNRLNTDAPNIGGTERTVQTISDYQSVIRSVVGPWLDRIEERAKQDNINLQALASPSPTTPEITSEADIDCDCKNAGGGLLEGPTFRQCQQVEANLKSQFREAKRVTGRCDPVASGPNARPKSDQGGERGR